jgi:glycosyltransferase involved in cell wall biosynthesis
MKVVAVTIANGLSSEVRVACTLLGAPSIDATVFAHAADREDNTPDRIARLSGARVVPFNAGVPGPDAGIPKIQQSAKFAAAIPKLVRLAREIDPDVIYSSQQIADCTMATFLARVLGKPQVIHLHYIIGPFLGWLPLRRLRNASLILTVSHFIRAQVIDFGCRPSRVEAILNTIEPRDPQPDDVVRSVRAELGARPGEVVVAMVGRFSPFKGQLESVEAFARAARDVPAARLVFVGDGGNIADVRARAQSLGIRSRVTFLGLRNDVPSLLSGFDIFIHPSYADPCPLAVLEAQAAGLPVVAFAEGGIPEIVQNGTTGILAPPRDIAGLSEALRVLLVDASQRRELGARGRERTLTKFAPNLAKERFASIMTRFASPTTAEPPSLSRAGLLQ